MKLCIGHLRYKVTNKIYILSKLYRRMIDIHDSDKRISEQ